MENGIQDIHFSGKMTNIDDDCGYINVGAGRNLPLHYFPQTLRLFLDEFLLDYPLAELLPEHSKIYARKK